MLTILALIVGCVVLASIVIDSRRKDQSCLLENNYHSTCKTRNNSTIML